MIESWWYSGAWALLVAVWVIGALGTKQTAHSEPVRRRAIHMFLMLLAAWLFFTTRVPDLLRQRFVPDTLLVFVTGAAITWLGLGFAIWARLTLGRNWSGSVEVKQGHRLVIRGPYRLARHPIYTGVLLAMAGTAGGTGELRCLLAVPLAFAGLWIKSRHEEEFMGLQFGAEYARYQARVKAIIPGLL